MDSSFVILAAMLAFFGSLGIVEGTTLHPFFYSSSDASKLQVTYNPDEIFVHADKEKLTQVMTNLLTNAIKFTTEGRISIVTRQDNECEEDARKTRTANLFLRASVVKM